jgi:DNA-binding transcriptional regulator YiaG
MIAQQIKKLREELNLTREQLAKMIGKTPRTIRSWEEGARCKEGIPRTELMLLEIVVRNINPELLKKYFGEKR